MARGVGRRRVRPGVREGRPRLKGGGRVGVEVVSPALVAGPVAEAQTPAFFEAPAVLSEITLADAERQGIVVALRLKGVPITRIADLVQTHPTDVRRILRNAREAGDLNDVLVDLTHDALPRAVEKLLDALDDGEPWAIQQTLKGLGAFKTYRQQETHGSQIDERTLHVQFEMPDQPVVVHPENIVGRPKGRIEEGADAVRVGRATPVLSLTGGEAGGDHASGRAALGPGVEGETPAGARVVASLAACVRTPSGA